MGPFPLSVSPSTAIAAAAFAGSILLCALVKKRRGQGKERSESAVAKGISHPCKATPSASNSGFVMVVGCGMIGSGFSTVFLAKGCRVIVVDPNASRNTIHHRIERNWKYMLARNLSKQSHPPLDTALIAVSSVEEAIAFSKNESQPITFVQECSWEDVDHKQQLLAELDRLLNSAVLICSSTSCIPWELLVTQCQSNTLHRIMIGHPAIPHRYCFMEIYGTYPDWVECCKKWYTSVGFDVIVLMKTIPGHVMNSIGQLIVRHGMDLVGNGVCSAHDVNTAIRHFSRVFYSEHFFLTFRIVVGGERGLAGAEDLMAKVQKDAIRLVLFSKMKEKGLPELIVRPLSKYLGRMLVGLVPQPPQEYMEAVEKVSDEIIQGGKITPDEGMFELATEAYHRIPFEVGNDPFKLIRRHSM